MNEIPFIPVEHMTEESPEGDPLLPPPTHSTERGSSTGLFASISQDGE